MSNNHLYKILEDKLTYNFFAYLFFIGFGIISIWDANARILITDPAYYLFNIINDSGFFVQAQRFTSVINQIFVVMAVKLKVPLNYLIIIYSISFVIIRFIYFFLANNIFKNRAAGFAIIAISVVGVAESYFRPTSESTIAMLNSCLLFAFLFFVGKKEWGKWGIIIQSSGTIIFVLFGYFTHPIALFSLIFVIIYYSLASRKQKTLYPYLALVFTLVVFMWKVFVSDNSEHHGGLYGNLITSPLSIFHELPEYYPYKFFRNHYNVLYKSLMLLFLSGSIMLLIKKKKLLNGLFFIGYMMFYFVIACTSFKEGDANMQMEKIFLPLVLFSALAFSDGLVTLCKKNRLVHILAVLFIVLYGYYCVNEVRPLYHGRIGYLKEIVEKAKLEDKRKLVVHSDQIDRKIVFSWAMGIETLMLSSVDKEDESLSVYCIQNSENLEGKTDNPGNFIAAHFRTSYNYSKFNKNYFKLPEQVYKIWDIDLK